jgi:hypothetical protein
MLLKPTKSKARLSALLMMIMLLLTLGLTVLNTPSANAACPIEGCNFPDPTPKPTLPVPPSRVIWFYVIDQHYPAFEVLSLKMTYYTVSNNQYVQTSRNATITNPFNVSGDHYINTNGYGKFFNVRLATNKPTTFTAYGKYASGQYGYKSVTVQNTVPFPSPTPASCYRWRVTSGTVDIATVGFYPTPGC